MERSLSHLSQICLRLMTLNARNFSYVYRLTSGIHLSENWSRDQTTERGSRTVYGMCPQLPGGSGPLAHILISVSVKGRCVSWARVIVRGTRAGARECKWVRAGENELRHGSVSET
eukprot:scaffold3158_cov47-Cyclotella_meneghiniana.AAC.4